MATQKTEPTKKNVAFLWKAALDGAVGPEMSKMLLTEVVDDLSLRVDFRDADDLRVKVCASCGSLLNASNSTFRLKPKAKMMCGVRKAITSGRNTSKKKRIRKKWIKSSSKLVIHCKSCEHIETIELLSRGDLSVHRKATAQCTPAADSRTSTPQSARRFDDRNASSSNSSTPSSSKSKNKRRRSSFLSQLLMNEKQDSSNSSLQDFLITL